MKRLIVIAAALLTLTAVSAVTATTSSASVCQTNGTGCTPATTYSGPNAVINSNYGGFKVVWTKSVVQSSSGQPVYWTAYLTYTNISSSPLTLVCPGDWVNASYVSEDMSGGSGDDGTVPAESTTCSENPNESITVQPNDTSMSFATFHNVPWPGSEVSITWGDAGTSPSVYAFKSSTFDDTDWANSSFCNRYKDAPPDQMTYKGVTACGNAENATNTSNSQGEISYITPSGTVVEFDSSGFQCVELAARYFYFQTTLVPDGRLTPGTGTDFVSTEHQNYSQIAISGVTDTFQDSLTPGNIISMWSSSDPTGEGHVGVVMEFQYTSGDLTGINIMDENANGSGTSTIKVSGGTMSFDGYNEFQWTTNLPGSG